MLPILLRDDEPFLNRAKSHVEPFPRGQKEIKQKYFLWKQPR